MTAILVFVLASVLVLKIAMIMFGSGDASADEVDHGDAEYFDPKKFSDPFHFYSPSNNMGISDDTTVD
ncbi:MULTISPECIES: hypothetical protein [unclassified Pseudoalteromonas]|uniref:hypothetical protein n=1 Tax=unclassified Pseudoalteromonas TaxID=194690 RepID=UPI00235994DC|nr:MULTISPECIES: hypothetical protein [unclassified Pseudoalteromonas]MDC9575615.1 hypothetical protein [Pseudoalteromonas sp. GABNS16A]MDC9611588.1 hypothetical protein [Pseudoalteromonas sp. GABNS16H]